MTQSGVLFTVLLTGLGVVMFCWPYRVAKLYEMGNAVGSTRHVRGGEPTANWVAWMRLISAIPLVMGGYALRVVTGRSPSFDLALAGLGTVLGVVLVVLPERVATLDARLNGLDRVVGDAPGPDARPSRVKVTWTRFVGFGAICVSGFVLLALLS